MLDGSSLVEVLVALVIIVAVFGIAMEIFMKITNSQKAVTSYKCNLQMKKILVESTKNRNWNDKDTSADRILYRKTVSAWRNSGDLFVIKIVAFNQGNKCDSLMAVVLKEEKE